MHPAGSISRCHCLYSMSCRTRASLCCDTMVAVFVLVIAVHLATFPDPGLPSSPATTIQSIQKKMYRHTCVAAPLACPHLSLRNDSLAVELGRQGHSRESLPRECAFVGEFALHSPRKMLAADLSRGHDVDEIGLHVHRIHG